MSKVATLNTSLQPAGDKPGRPEQQQMLLSCLPRGKPANQAAWGSAYQHTQPGNKQEELELCAQPESERDLRILMDNKLKMSEQCAAAAKKSNRVLGDINKGITSRDCHCPTLVSSFQVTPGTLCSVLAMLYKRLGDRLKRDQRRAVKMFKRLGSCYMRKGREKWACSA